MKHTYKFPFSLQFEKDVENPVLSFNGITVVESHVDLQNSWYLVDAEYRNFSDIIGREILFSERARHCKGDFTKTSKISSLKAGKNNTLVLLGLIDTVREMLGGTYSLYLRKLGGTPENKIKGQIDIEWETPVKKIQKGTYNLNLEMSVALNDFKAYSNPEYRKLVES